MDNNTAPGAPGDNTKPTTPSIAPQLLDTPHLAESLESDRFKQFLDHAPFAVVVAELEPSERITYANMEFERLTSVPRSEIEGATWAALNGCVSTTDATVGLGRAISEQEDYLGIFQSGDHQTRVFEAWSSLIQDDNGVPLFRLAAFADVSTRQSGAELTDNLREKDTLLRELQHRVKNNLQMITALIRMEARNLPDNSVGDRFDRLAGRVSALSLLYSALSSETDEQSVDLGVYLSRIASAVMEAHAIEGIRLDLKVDTWPVSVNVAMPAGLVVNELLTNSLKHAFLGRDHGTITLHSLVDERGCRVVIADDGIGLADGTTWPQAGKLGALIVESLRSNARAQVQVESSRACGGMRVTIFFARADAAPDPE